MEVREILQRATPGVVVVRRLIEFGEQLCVVFEAHSNSAGFFFWSDGVFLPRSAAFVLDGSTGEVKRGGKCIKKVVSALDLKALPWPSDDPHCTNIFTCAIYLDKAKLRSEKEIREFLIAVLNIRGKSIVVSDYPPS